MQISRIMNANFSNTPKALETPNKCCGPKSGNLIKFNNGLSADTVSFSGDSRQKLVTDVVNNAFAKLFKARKNGVNSTYMATEKEVNIFLRETEFGKKAQLTLSNGVFGDKSYINLELNRENGKPVSIKALDSDISEDDAATLASTYLKD